MYSQTLPHLLGGVRAPALVVWGDDDKIVPRSAGERYARGAAERAARDRRRTAAIAWTWSSRDGARRARSRRFVTPAERDRPTLQREEDAMHLMYFTEQPMSAYPTRSGLEFGATALMFSNRHFDPVAGSRLYNEYLEQYIYAEEVGIDGIMLNEHHNAPFCMQAKANIFASILAAVTKRVKIVMLGNPLPLAENPIRLAEELAMIDMISKGRLVSGFVRGGGQEQLATGVNPAYNRERFEEAHDLIVKTWTQPGPFRWEGTHYQHRVVNPVGGAAAEALSARLDPGRAQPGDDHLGGAAALSLHRAQHLDRGDQADLGALRRGGGRGRLHGRPGEPRLSAAGPRRRDRGEGDRERPPVHVDAGRVHRPGAPGVGQPVGLLLAEQPARLRRVRGRPGQEPARPPDLRGADRRRADHRRHAEDGDRRSCAHPRGDAARHHGALGQRRQRQPRGLARPASACSARR